MKKPASCSCNCQLKGSTACMYFKPLKAEEIPHPFVFDVEPLEFGNFAQNFAGTSGLHRTAYYAFTLAPSESIDVFLSPLRFTVDGPLNEGDSVQAAEITNADLLGIGKHWWTQHNYDVSAADIMFNARQKTLLPLGGLGHLTPAVPTDLFFQLSRSYAENRISTAVFGNGNAQVPTAKLGYFQIRINGNPVGPLYSEDSFAFGVALTSVHLHFTSSRFNYRMYDKFQLEYDAGDTIEFDVWPRLVVTNQTASGIDYVWSAFLNTEGILDAKTYASNNLSTNGFAYFGLARAVYPCANFNFNKQTYHLTSDTGGVDTKIVRGLAPQVWEVKYLGDDFTGYTYATSSQRIIPSFYLTEYRLWIRWGDTVEDMLKRSLLLETVNERRKIDPNIVQFDLQDVEGGFRIISRYNLNVNFTMASSDHFSLTEIVPFSRLTPTRKTLTCYLGNSGVVYGTGFDPIPVSYATTAGELEAAMNPEMFRFGVTETRHTNAVVFMITNYSWTDWIAQNAPGFYLIVYSALPATTTDVERVVCQDGQWYNANTYDNIYFMDHYQWTPVPITDGEMTITQSLQFHIPPTENVHIRLAVTLRAPAWMFGFAPSNTGSYVIYFTAYYQPAANGDYVEAVTFFEREVTLGALGPFNYLEETVFERTRFATYNEDTEEVVGEWYIVYSGSGGYATNSRVFPVVYAEGEAIPIALRTMIHPIAQEILDAMETYRPNSFTVTAVDIDEE